MKYAVVKIQGSLSKVSEGDQVEVSRLSCKEGETIELEEVLLVADEGKVTVGRPTVKGAKVNARVERLFQGKKMDIFKFKAKTGYRRHIGFRPQRTLLKIEKIVT